MFRPNSSHYHIGEGIEICPPLPDPIEVDRLELAEIMEILSGLERMDPEEFVWPSPVRRLPTGCYLARLEPLWTVNYDNYHWDGTIRVTTKRLFFRSFSKTISGDLYLHDPDEPGMDFEEPDPSQGIPIFPIASYDYYIEVTGLKEKASEVVLTFKLWHFNHSDDESSLWNEIDTFTANMRWVTAPPDYPDSDLYLEGTVLTSDGHTFGTLKMGWISDYIRRASIEIDRELASETPLDNGDTANWASILNAIGWDIRVFEDETNLVSPTPTDWDRDELHQEMLNRRDAVDLDTEWRYHLLCVQEYVDADVFGVMYDNRGTDSNDVPREGAAAFSHQFFPNMAKYGTCQGRRLGDCTGPYFRTAIHEIGHAMLQYHPGTTDDNYIMQQTWAVVDNATGTNPYPDNIIYDFKSTDKHRLRHLPDIAVRPGGIPFEYTGSIPEAKGVWVSYPDYLRFVAAPHLEIVPLGAPVRINLSLLNTSKEKKSAPSMSMKKGFIHGEVVDPTGKIRRFSTILRYIYSGGLDEVEPNEEKTHSLTLLRGKDGALFPLSGVYKVRVYLNWRESRKCKRLIAETRLIVTPPVDTEHAKTALHLLNTPNTLLSLVIGGDHMKDGIKAIQKGLDHPTLRPHYAYIEAKRLSSRFRDRKPDLKTAIKLVDEAIMTPAEVKSISRRILRIKKEVSETQIERIKDILSAKMKDAKIDKETSDLLKSLK